MERDCFCCQVGPNLLLLLLVSSATQTQVVMGCTETLPSKYVREGTSATIDFSLRPPTMGTVPYVVQLNSVSVISITYINDTVEVDDGYPNVSFTGDAATGEISFQVSYFGRASAGNYTLQNLGLKPLQCITVYTLGIPDVVVEASAEKVNLGETISFTCSFTSTTVPSIHGISLNYNWTISSTTNITSSRIIYTNNTLTISNVSRTDHNKTVTCWVTEDIAGGLTSSKQVQINVIYGPDFMQLLPNMSVHVLNEGSPLDITCMTDCFPACTYAWVKQESTSSVTTDQHLSIVNISRNHSGIYECTTRNEEINQNKSTKVTVLVRYGPDVVTLTPSADTYTDNEGLFLDEISCSADCYPNCTYVWAKDGQIVSRNNILLLCNLSREETGIYMCTVANPGTASIASSNITVNVRYGPDVVTLIPSADTYMHNEGSLFNETSCSADCYPNCTYVWAKDGQIISGNSSLSLGYLSRDETGTYVCTVYNPGTSRTATSNITVNVHYGPHEVTLIPPAETYTENEGSFFDEISCSANCYPNCTYVWARDGQRVSRNNILSLGTLSKEETGIYSCIASNPGTSNTASSNITVNVRYGPFNISLVPPERDYSVVEGQTLPAIYCSSHCYPGCLQEWKNAVSDEKQGQAGNLSLGFMYRFLAGEYECTSSNQAIEYNKSVSVSIQVNVKYFPAVSIIQENGNDVTENDAIVSLLCSAKGKPDTYSFAQWNHIAPDNHTKLQKYFGIANGNQNRLLLQDISYQDSGIYHCSATNTIEDYKTGKLFATESFNLTVKGRAVLNSTTTRIAADEHNNVTVNVTFYSNDETEPLIAWWKKDEKSKTQLQSGNHKYTVDTSRTTIYIPFYLKTIQQPGYLCQLLISNISKSDFATYQIEVINSVGSVTSDITISPTGPPEMPLLFSTVPALTTDTTLTLTWQPGFHSGADQTFHVDYRVNGTLEWQTGLSIFGGKHTVRQFNATISKLSWSTRYQFSLYADNRYGKSEESVIVAETTGAKEAPSEQDKDNDLVIIAGVVGGGIVGIIFVAVLVPVIIYRYRRRHLRRKRRRKHRWSSLYMFFSRRSRASFGETEQSKDKKKPSNSKGKKSNKKQNVTSLHLYDSVNIDNLNGSRSTSKKEGKTYDDLTADDQNHDYVQLPKNDYLHVVASGEYIDMNHQRSPQHMDNQREDLRQHTDSPRQGVRPHADSPRQRISPHADSQRQNQTDSGETYLNLKMHKK